MQEYIDFVSDNPLYFIGFFVILGLIIKVEISRFNRKFKMLNTNEAVKLINNDDTVIVDVREDRERNDGGIKKAKQITLAQLPSKLGQLGSNKQVPILVYCRTGARSPSACNTLIKEGFENVSSLSGGILAWETANLPIEK